MSPSDICTKAAEIVSGDRDRQHGDYRDNLTRIAAYWQAYMETRRDSWKPLTGADVAEMMALLKIARTQSGAHNPDDYIDAAGYIALAGAIWDDA